MPDPIPPDEPHEPHEPPAEEGPSGEDPGESPDRGDHAPPRTEPPETEPAEPEPGADQPEAGERPQLIDEETFLRQEYALLDNDILEELRREDKLRTLEDILLARAGGLDWDKEEDRAKAAALDAELNADESLKNAVENIEKNRREKIAEAEQEREKEEEASRVERGLSEEQARKEREKEEERKRESDRLYSEVEKAVKAVVDDPTDTEKRKALDDAIRAHREHDIAHEIKHIAGRDPVWSYVVTGLGLVIYTAAGAMLFAANSAINFGESMEKGRKH